MGYRYFDTFGKEVSYPFGHGLSYTTFEYAVEEAAIDGDRCRMKVSVKNTGKVAGREAVQLYVKAPEGGMDKPAKELKAFGKTRLLKPGESQTLTLEWNVMDMASFNEKSSSWEFWPRVNINGWLPPLRPTCVAPRCRRWQRHASRKCTMPCGHKCRWLCIPW